MKPDARNVLLIVVDPWPGDGLGVLGHSAALTPNLDAGIPTLPMALRRAGIDPVPVGAGQS